MEDDTERTIDKWMERKGWETHAGSDYYWPSKDEKPHFHCTVKNAALKTTEANIAQEIKFLGWNYEDSTDNFEIIGDIQTKFDRKRLAHYLNFAGIEEIEKKLKKLDDLGLR